MFFGAYSDLVAGSAGALVPVGLLYLRARHYAGRRGISEAPPVTEKMLRPPGHTLSLRLDGVYDQAISRLVLASVSSAFATMSVVMLARTMGHDASGWIQWTVAAFSALLCGVAVVLTVQMFQSIRRLRALRLGMRGEQVVGELLNGTGAGFRVFHDFPGGENWNIDHVMIGPGGVFAIETKTRRRKLLPGPNAAHKVHVTGGRLEYAHAFDEDAIPQARRNAQDLSAHLSRAVGRHVPVEPVVVLPGYFVESAPDAAACVMNPKYLVEILRRLPPQLTLKEVDTLALFVDRKCRDVEF